MFSGASKNRRLVSDIPISGEPTPSTTVQQTKQKDANRKIENISIPTIEERSWAALRYAAKPGSLKDTSPLIPVEDLDLLRRTSLLHFPTAKLPLLHHLQFRQQSSPIWLDGKTFFGTETIADSPNNNKSISRHPLPRYLFLPFSLPTVAAVALQSVTILLPYSTQPLDGFKTDRLSATTKWTTRVSLCIL